jgi:hypothetical protein
MIASLLGFATATLASPGVAWALMKPSTSTGDNTLSTISMQAPVAVSAATKPAGAVLVSWNASPTAAIRAVQYLVFRRPAGSGSYVQVTGSPVAGLAYSDVPAADGSYDYRVETYLSNFTSPDSNVVTGLSDRLPPAVSVTCNAAACGNGWYTASVTVAITATDGGSGVASITRMLDGTPTTTAGATVSFAIASDLIHVLRYQAADVAGNVSTLQTINIDIDRTAPVISRAAECNDAGLVPPTAANWIYSAGPFRIYAQVSDALSGVASVTADVGLTGSAPYVTGVVLTATAAKCAGVSYNFVSATEVEPGLVVAGTNVMYVDVVATDVAGNVAHSNLAHAGNISVDDTGPAGSTVTDVLGGAGTGQVTIDWTADVAGPSGMAGYELEVFFTGTTTPATQYPLPIDVGTGTLTRTFTLTPGVAYDFVVTGVDNAGNSIGSTVTDTAP